MIERTDVGSEDYIQAEKKVSKFIQERLFQVAATGFINPLDDEHSECEGSFLPYDDMGNYQ